MIIEIQGVTKRFGTVTAVDRVDLTVADGEPSGWLVEKTTLPAGSISSTARHSGRSRNSTSVARLSCGACEVRSAIEVIPRRLASSPRIAKA